MSLVINVHRSFPCAHACDDAIVNSGSGASSKASTVAMVCVINSRIASRTVAAMFASSGAWRAAGSSLAPAEIEIALTSITARVLSASGSRQPCSGPYPGLEVLRPAGLPFRNLNHPSEVARRYLQLLSRRPDTLAADGQAIPLPVL